MEGLVEAPAPKPSPHPGYAMSALVTAIAYGLHYLPFAPFQISGEDGLRRPVSAAILAILVGALARNLAPVSDSIVEGCRRLVKRLLPVAIVLAGVGMNLGQMAAIGVRAFLITVAALLLALAATYYLGRAFGLGSRPSLLVSAGTAICGTSAIVTVAPLIEADDQDMILSVSAINLMGLALMFAMPFAGQLLGVSDQVFGVWAGTAIHTVPQVVTAGFAFSQQAGTVATLVKLVRVAMLAPLAFVLALAYAQQRSRKVKVYYTRLIPTFIWGFLALAALNTLSLIPSLQFHLPAETWGASRHFTISLETVLSEAGGVVLALAMGAMGLEVNTRLLAGVGGRAMLTAIASSVALCAASLALIRVLL